MSAVLEHRKLGWIPDTQCRECRHEKQSWCKQGQGTIPCSIAKHALDSPLACADTDDGNCQSTAASATTTILAWCNPVDQCLLKRKNEG